MKKHAHIIRSLLALAMVLVLAMSFIGCNSETGNTETVVTFSPTTDATTESESTIETSTEADTNKVTAATKPVSKPTDATVTKPASKPDETTDATTVPSATKPSTPEVTTPKPTETTAPIETTHTHRYVKHTTSATCTDGGYTLYECTCGYSYKDSYTSALGHNYKTETTPATCTGKGYSETKCTRCGNISNSAFTDANGHSWGNWTVTKEATTSAEGTETRTCSVCNKSETRAVAKLEVPTETIDTAALAAYGRSYGENNYDFVANVGTRACYYPTYTRTINTMDEGYSQIAACVSDTANCLIAYGSSTKTYLDVVVEHAYDNIYYVTVYYA